MLNLNKLKEQLDSMTDEQLDESFKEVEGIGSNGPTVSEFIAALPLLTDEEKTKHQCKEQ